MSATSRIAAGLAAYDGPESSSLASFANGPKSLTDLITAASNASLRHEKLVKRLDVLRSDEARATAEIERLADSMGLRGPDRVRYANTALAERRREIRANSEKDRYTVLRELQEFESSVNSIAPLFESASHLLAREGLGSEERSRLTSQIAHSGPTELVHFARLAVANGDRVLGASVMARLDSLPSDQRRNVGVSRQALADALVGEDFKKASEAIAIVRNRAREAIHLNRNYEAGRVNAHARVGDALARRKESGALDSGN